MTDFIRARNAELDAETVLPASALPYLAGWEAVQDEQAEPAVEPPADAPTSVDELDAAPADEPVTPGSTPVGRPTRKPKES